MSGKPDELIHIPTPSIPFHRIVLLTYLDK